MLAGVLGQAVEIGVRKGKRPFDPRPFPRQIGIRHRHIVRAQRDGNALCQKPPDRMLLERGDRARLHVTGGAGFDQHVVSFDPLEKATASCRRNAVSDAFRAEVQRGFHAVLACGFSRMDRDVETEARGKGEDFAIALGGI